MNPNDILRMAREAGWTDYSLLHSVEVRRLEQFAALIAAHEREAAAKECETLLPSKRIFDQRYYEAVEDCVATIRARGEK